MIISKIIFPFLKGLGRRELELSFEFCLLYFFLSCLCLYCLCLVSVMGEECRFKVKLDLFTFLTVE